ncbi:hypothetical protein [Pseudomonas huaxiensis]|uniref:hypothetical protein n=1 Tax=Pseudomonas huaxiensis TaxID=2213017 RepID=UPI000DA64EDE|nr:hypothetical protein [Pseudomonas huaxiensis]
MENFIRNGDFREGLNHWKANREVDTAKDGDLHYAFFGQGIQIRQEFSGLEGGTNYIFRMETSRLPLESAASLPSIGTDPAKWLTLPSEVWLRALMVLSLNDGSIEHIISKPCIAYPSWGMAGFLFTAPVGFKSGIATILVPVGEDQPKIEMGVTHIEIVKA